MISADFGSLLMPTAAASSASSDPRASGQARADAEGRGREKVFPSLERWKARRAAVGAYFVGPALLNIGIIGICAVVLPGADVFLQVHNRLGTAIFLGMADSFGGVALTTGLSVYPILTHR